MVSLSSRQIRSVSERSPRPILLLSASKLAFPPSELSRLSPTTVIATVDGKQYVLSPAVSVHTRWWHCRVAS